MCKFLTRSNDGVVSWKVKHVEGVYICQCLIYSGPLGIRPQKSQTQKLPTLGLQKSQTQKSLKTMSYSL